MTATERVNAYSATFNAGGSRAVAAFTVHGEYLVPPRRRRIR